MIGENDEGSEELLYDAEMKPIIEDRLKNGKRIRISRKELLKMESKTEFTQQECDEAWKQLNQMLSDSKNSGRTDLTMNDVLEMSLERIKKRND